MVALLSLGCVAQAGEEVDWSAVDSVDTSEFDDEESGFAWDFKSRADIESSVLWADGVTLTEYSFYPQLTSDLFDLGISIAYSGFELDYEPEVFGSDENLSANQIRYAFDGRLSLGKQWNLLATTAYYDGFGDYQSLWISEYYEQLFGEVPSYIGPSPKGFSTSLGLEWEYVPVVAKLRITGGYSKDTIAPSYDVGDTGIERGRPNLYTNFVQLEAENVLTSRFVLQNSLQYTNTTNREKRWGFQTSANVAILDNLFFRGNAGFAVEQPRFDAFYFGGSLEYQFADSWFARINARYYEDTGEIQNSLGGFDTSAPPLESFELGAGIRWQGVNSALNFYVGYYQTDYEALSFDNEFLKNLYNDRRWGLLQLTFTHNF